MADRKQSLRAFIMGMVGLMALCMLMLMGWVVVREQQEARLVEWNSLAIRITDVAIQASALVARERGLRASLLAGQDVDPALSAELDTLRDKGNVRYRQLTELAAAMAAAAPEHPVAETIGMLAAAQAALEAARHTVEQATIDGRNIAAATAWIDIATRYIDALAHLRRESAMGRDPERSGASGSDGLILLEAASQASEHTGRERAIVAAAIAAGRPLTPSRLIELQNYRAITDESLDILGEYASHRGGALGPAYVRIQREFIDRLDPLRQKIFQASRANTPYPVSEAVWFAQATSAIDAILEFSGHVRQENLERLAIATASTQRTRLLLAVALAVLAVLLIVTARALRQRILAPLDALAAAARRIARGELAEPIRPLRQDEIGVLALAFDDMRLVLQRDIQQIHAAEAAVRDQELRLRTIIDMAGEAVISVDRQQKIILFNKSAEAIFGYRQEEALGQPLDILIPEEARGRHQGQVQGFAATAAGARNMKERGLIQGRRRDGSVFPAEASISKLRIGDEQIFTVILRDIGERRRIEEAQARLTAIVESSTDIIGTADRDGNVLYLNMAGRRFWGLGESEPVAGLRISDIHSAWALSQTMHEGIPYAIRDGFWHGESELRNPAGQLIPVSQLILAHKDNQGRLLYLSSVMRDISERKQSEEELRASHRDLKDAFDHLEQIQAQLLQSEKMASIGQLAAGVAHEINNPVGYIASNLGTLAKYVDSLLEMVNLYEVCEDMLDKESPAFQLIVMAKQKTDLGYVREDVVSLVKESREGITRVKKIVQDLKEFSHVDRAEWQEADLHQGIDSTLNIVNNEIKYKAEVVKEYGTLPMVECIPAQLNQVFMNLLVNAAQAIDTRGTITIKTGTDYDGVYVEIRDTGQGMPVEVQKRIFEPFFTTKAVGQGTGLGLSLSYTIIKKHHGEITVTSVPGRGTTFRVRVPVRQVYLDQEHPLQGVGT